MDNLTHSLFGVTLGRTRLGRAGRGTTAALVLASNAPDVDAIAGLKGGASYLAWHRGPTHGVLGIAVLGVASAALVWAVRYVVDRRRPPAAERPAASFAMLCAVSMTAVAFHILMDLPTSYGTRLLSPFDWRWFAVDWMPIVDIYLLGVLVAGALFGQASEASRYRNASIVLTLTAAIYGVRAFAHREALESAPQLFGPALPQRCQADTLIDAGLVSWPSRVDASPPRSARCLVDLAAIPTFTSPFRWRLVAHLSNAYELHDVDVLDTRLRQAPPAAETFWRMTIRYPNVWSPAVETAAMTRLGQRFLGFSRFPAARWVVDTRSGTTTVRWTDMRFVAALPLNRAAGGASLFTATVRLDEDRRVIDEHFGP